MHFIGQIHDYHLMCVPGLVRRMAEEAGLPCRIGYFLHIPFPPPWDLLRIHPWKDIFLQVRQYDRRLLDKYYTHTQGMLGSDLIGFQCSDYLLNFLDCCERGLRTRVDRQLGLVDHGAGGQTGLGRQVGYHGPGQELCKMWHHNLKPTRFVCGHCPWVSPTPSSGGWPGRPRRHSSPSRPPLRFSPVTTAMLSFTEPHQVVLSVDTLDFTKGLQHRVAAWERLLDRYHIHRGAATLVQARHVTLAAGGC